MSIASTMAEPVVRPRAHRHLWYFPLLGAFCGAAVLAAAALPPTLTALTLVAIQIASSVIDGLVRRYSMSPVPTRLINGAHPIAYGALVAAMLVGAFMVDWFVVRPSGELWLAWVMASAVFGIVALGARVVVGYPASE